MRRTLFIITCLISISAVAQQQQPAQLSFDEAVKIGLQRNVLLNQQKNQLEVNQAQKLSSYGNFLPNINFNSNYQRQKGQQQNTTSGDLENLTTDYINGQISGNLVLFNGFRLVNTHSQANNQLNAQTYLVKKSTQDVISSVASQYLQVLLDQELLRIADENLKAQKALMEQIQGFFDVGSKAITDVYNQDALLKAAQVAFVRARNTLQNDKSILAQTLQLDPAQDFQVTSPKLEYDLNFIKSVSLDSLISIAQTNRADLQQAEYQAKANRHAMRSSFGTFTPTLSIFANYNSFYYSQIKDNFNAQFRTINPSLSYGATLSIPLFTKFQNRTQYVTSKVTYQNSVLTKQNVEKTVKIDVQRAYNNYMNAIEAYESSLAQFQAGELALNTQRESYQLGITAQVALAQANQTYVQGAASKAQAEVTLIFQKVLLSNALGTLREEDVQ